MTELHHALVVEDDPATAEDLEEILKSLSCRSTVVNNKTEALALLGKESFCFVLLDLEIKLTRDSIKGHAEHGLSLLREARTAHPEHVGIYFRMPILIVSGFARERDAAVGVMKLGAHDVIQKPLKMSAVSDAVRQALDATERSTHAMCGASPAPPKAAAAPGARVRIAIPGERQRRRTRVLVGTGAVDLPDSALAILLHLMVARLKNEVVHKQDLAGAEVEGFKGVSRLRDYLRPFLGETNIIKNEYHGNYRLVDDVEIGDCDTAKLIEIGDAKIAKLARELARLTKKDLTEV